MQEIRRGEVGQRSSVFQKVRRYAARRQHLPYVGPFTVWNSLFIAIPLLIVVYLSFLTSGPAGEVIGRYTLENYRKLVKLQYGVIFLRTLGYDVATTLICLLLGYPLAYWITRKKGMWKHLLLFLLILPLWTLYLIRLYALKTIMARGGLLNSLLLWLHVSESPIPMLYNPFAVLLGLVYIWLPFMVLPIYSALDGLDPALLESALDLGASPASRFVTVVLPLTKGGIYAGIILVFIPSLGDWVVPVLMGGGKSLFAANLIELHAIHTGNIVTGCSMAVPLVVTVTVLIYLGIKVAGEEVLERML